MQQHLDPKIVTKALSVSRPQRASIKFTSLASFIASDRRVGKSLSSLEPELATSIFVSSRKKGRAVLIELKSSKKPGHIERDASKALEQIIDKNY